MHDFIAHTAGLDHPRPTHDEGHSDAPILCCEVLASPWAHATVLWFDELRTIVTGEYHDGVVIYGSTSEYLFRIECHVAKLVLLV